MATALGGKQLRGSTILVTNEEGKIEHAVVQHRPLEGSRHFYPAEFPLSGLFFHGQQRLKMCKMQMEHPKRSGRRTGSVILSESSTTWEINALVARSPCIIRPLFPLCLKTSVP